MPGNPPFRVQLTKVRDMHCVTRFAVIAIAGLALAAPAAFAEPTDLKELAEDPQSFLDKEIELVGYCVKGGKAGDVLGYECTTDAGVYVAADDIEPEAAKKTLADCAATKSDECQATVKFEAYSFSTSGVIEPGKKITIFNAEKANVSF